MAQKIASPFGGYYIYPDDPNNLFQQLLGVKSGSTQETSSELTPPVDIFEDDAAFYASIEMPGVNKDEIKIACTEGALTVNASVDRAGKGEGHWVQHERRIGTYVRSIRFRSAIVTDNISAKYENGVLELTVPKRSTEQKSISISVD